MLKIISSLFLFAASIIIPVFLQAGNWDWARSLNGPTNEEDRNGGASDAKANVNNTGYRTFGEISQSGNKTFMDIGLITNTQRIPNEAALDIP